MENNYNSYHQLVRNTIKRCIGRNNRDVLEVLKTADFHRIQKDFDGLMKIEARSYRNYMLMFENILAVHKSLKATVLGTLP